MAKRVWILGAGFSQPLGGPLLKDFFRSEPLSSCIATYPRERFPTLAYELFALQIGFHWGREHAGHWDDAEQFLGFIDDAYTGQDASKRQKLADMISQAHRPHFMAGTSPLRMKDTVQHVPQFFENLDRTARRALAAQCDSFLLHRQPMKEEAWSPYRRWATSLEPAADAIITFNYDRVLQELDPNQTTLQVLKPDESEDQGKRTPVYRLHGGVDWALEDGKIVSRAAPDLLESQEAQIAIAAPGRGKTHFVAAHFDNLWKRAEVHLSQAATVFLVGYGFPKSDSEALRRILDALKLKECPAQVRDFHVVLGAETTDATQRVAALLQGCTSGRCLRMVPPTEPLRGPVEPYFRLLRIKQHPLWTQDFLWDWQDRIKDVEIKP